MNNQTILFASMIVVAAGAIIYYIYTQNNTLAQRIQSQEDIITSMRVRFENMESIFMRGPEAEIESIFEKRVADPYKRGGKKECVDDICTFTPYKFKGPPRIEEIAEAEEKGKDASISSGLSNAELDEIADKELADMMDEKK